MATDALIDEPRTNVRIGTRADFDGAFADLYEEARQVARRTLRSGLAPWHPGSTMNTTALVNEAYLRLHRRSGMRWNDQHHFLALVARAMRFAFVDYARAHRCEKRGGDGDPLPLQELRPATEPMTDRLSDEIISLDQALERLAERGDRLAQVVECRFIVGLSIEETAAALGVSGMTVKRDWITARAFLSRELRGNRTPADDEGSGR